MKRNSMRCDIWCAPEYGIRNYSWCSIVQKEIVMFLWRRAARTHLTHLNAFTQHSHRRSRLNKPIVAFLAPFIEKKNTITGWVYVRFAMHPMIIFPHVHSIRRCTILLFIMAIHNIVFDRPLYVLRKPLSTRAKVVFPFCSVRIYIYIIKCLKITPINERTHA